MLRRGIVVISLLSVLLAACGGGDDAEDSSGGDSDTGSGGGTSSDSLIGLVEALPDLGEETFYVYYGDVAGIAEANGVDVPTDGDLDSVLEWASSGLDGGIPVYLPVVLQQTRLAQHDEYEDELGVSLWGTTRFAGVDQPPRRVALLEGDHSADDLTEAIGEPDDGIWALGGDDFDVSLEDATAARPLGEALRLAVTDADRIAIGVPEELVRDAVDGRTSIADEGLEDVLAALDDDDLVSGIITRSPNRDGDPVTNAVAFGSDGDEITGRFVLGYDDEATASDAVSDVEAHFAEATSTRTGQPLSEIVDVREVRAEGAAIVVELDFGPDHLPMWVASMIQAFPDDLPPDRSAR